ncbi:MAG: tyrosine-type recombinase/integrase [Gammaproteobacteria bacterium]|nr:tyrosine-type recombinase/integrase [Gammaproteobacteria bacterium]
MSKVVELRQPSFSGKSEKPTPPRKPKNADVRSREHLTPGEVDKLLSAAGKLGRHGHRDKILIFVTYRHGLRVSELVALRWDQVDLKAELVHINRRKNGTPSTHPLGGTEIRALRKLKRDYPATQYGDVSPNRR